VGEGVKIDAAVDANILFCQLRLSPPCNTLILLP
jgi:hypothetical protein